MGSVIHRFAASTRYAIEACKRKHQIKRRNLAILSSRKTETPDVHTGP